jgi:serine/threonine-protein kinase
MTAAAFESIERSESSESVSDPAFAEWVEELAGRLQTGEPVDLEACASAHPVWAERLRRLVPAIAVMADLGRSAAAGSDGGSGLPTGLGPGLGELGDFRLLREVGRGGTGIVYEAEQISLGRRVALKVLPVAAAMDGKQLPQFQLEAHAAACLHHTNIVPVRAVGCERGVPFYAMQFIEGRSLAQLIGELRRLEGLERTEAPPADLASISTSTLGADLMTGRLAPARPEGKIEEAKAGEDFRTQRSSPHATQRTPKLDAALFVLEDFLDDLEKVVHTIFAQAHTDPTLAANIAKWVTQCPLLSGTY